MSIVLTAIGCGYTAYLFATHANPWWIAINAAFDVLCILGDLEKR